MTTPGWWLGHPAANPYFALTDRCNAERPRIILASGQACVWYRLTLASKDGDWIIRETEADCRAVLAILAAMGARYRLGAPLHPRWLAAGWSSHFEATSAEGFRLRFDFVSRPPRIPAEDLAMLWREVEDGAPAVVRRRDLIRLKQTMRMKDYPFIGALALELQDDSDRLRWSLDPQVMADLLRRRPDLRDRITDIRPALTGVALDPDDIAVAIDAEIRRSRAVDERRIEAYQRALEPWAERFRSIDTSALPLMDAHARLCAEAAGLLTDRPPC